MRLIAPSPSDRNVESGTRAYTSSHAATTVATSPTRKIHHFMVRAFRGSRDAGRARALSPPGRSYSDARPDAGRPRGGPDVQTTSPSTLPPVGVRPARRATADAAEW